MNDLTAVPSQVSSPSAGLRTYAARPFNLAAGTRRRRREQAVNLLMPILLLGAWEAVARLELIDPRFFSAPSQVVGALGDLQASGDLWLHAGASLRRVLIGFLAGGVAGVLMGMAVGLSWLVRSALRPLVAATYPVPKVALLPVLLLVFGLGDTAIVVLVGIAVFYQVLINTAAGVANIPTIYFDVAKTFEAGRWRYLRTVALPGALPVIFAAVRLAWGMALIVVVAAEFTSANEGLGQLIIRSWQVFSVERMFAGLVVTGVIGWVSFLLIDWAERLLIPWKAES
jgi:ABC-type nitrate/sulfonate/bicarbonate transport system permease component